MTGCLGLPFSLSLQILILTHRLKLLNIHEGGNPSITSSWTSNLRIERIRNQLLCVPWEDHNCYPPKPLGLTAVYYSQNPSTSFLLAGPGWPVKMKDSSQPGTSILGFTKDQPTRLMATVKWQRSCLWGWKSALPVFYKQGDSGHHQCASIFLFPLFTLRNYEMEVERLGVKCLQMSLSFTSERWTVIPGPSGRWGQGEGWQKKRFLET